MHVCNSISLWVLILSHELKKSAERPGQRYGFSAHRRCFLSPGDGCLLVSICLQCCALQVGLICWSCYHYWTLLDTGQEQKHLGLVPCYWVVYSAVGYWRREKEMIIAVFFMCTLIESVLDPWFGVSWTKAEVRYRIADKSCDLCCDQQDLLLIVWTNTFAVIVI